MKNDPVLVTGYKTNYMVCVARSDESAPARCVSILLRVAPLSSSLNWTPIPAVLLPCEPTGVIHTTRPATGNFSLLSMRDSNIKTSSPILYGFAVGINRPPFLINGMYEAYKALLSRIVNDRMPCLGSRPPGTLTLFYPSFFWCCCCQWIINSSSNP